MTGHDWDAIYAWERKYRRRWRGPRPATVTLRYDRRPSDGCLVPSGRRLPGSKSSPVVRRLPSPSSSSAARGDVSIDVGRRTISGIASSRVGDRVHDVVEPSGARFADSIPLLLHHDSEQPIGIARLKHAENEITFTAELPVITEPGPLKDRIDLAWQSVRYGLLRGVSIGFLALANARERLGNGGTRFTETEIAELSLVAVPMNRNAGITAIGAKLLEFPNKERLSA